jgi:hypothetical protein
VKFRIRNRKKSLMKGDVRNFNVSKMPKAEVPLRKEWSGGILHLRHGLRESVPRRRSISLGVNRWIP